MADAETRLCTQCKQSLPLSDFGIKRHRKDGFSRWCKPCCVNKSREYARKHPDWRERKRTYDKARIEANRDRLSKQWREIYERNRDRALENAKAWASRNPDKRRLISQSYKHRRRSIEGAGMSWSELRDWKAAQSKVCHWCGKDCARGYTVDHVIPLSKGGAHEANNLVIACRSCNCRKSARDPLEFAAEVGRSTASPDMLKVAA